MDVIMISGKAGSGKDFIADKIKNYLEDRNNKVLVIHFGDQLKFICEKYFNWDGKKDKNGRTLLQTVGTEEIRNWDPLYFVKSVMYILNMYDYYWDYVIIPDLRFINEYEITNRLFKTKTIRKSRTEYHTILTEEQQKNQSETEMDNFSFDYYINDYNEIEFDEIMEEIING